MKKALVLSSGGVDSTTCLGIAIDMLGKENISTVSFQYGQKHSKELECASMIAQHYGVKNYVLNIKDILQYSNCSLLNQSTDEIIHKSYDEQLKETGKVSTYVPFRNGLMLSAAASLALSLYPNDEVEIYLGAHADDATGSAYPDCSSMFTCAMGEAIFLGSGQKVYLASPLIKMNKTQVVAEGLKLQVPYELTWSCYVGEEKSCGTCGTCIDRLKAFKDNNKKDPIAYKY